MEPLLDHGPCRNRVVSNRRAEHDKAARVDKLPIGLDHGLHRPLRKTLHFPKHDLHRAIDHALFQSVLEHQLERLGQIVAPLLRKPVGQLEVEEIPELDGLSAALVGHLATPSPPSIPAAATHNARSGAFCQRAVAHRRRRGASPTAGRGSGLVTYGVARVARPMFSNICAIADEPHVGRRSMSGCIVSASRTRAEGSLTWPDRRTHHRRCAR
jgi:hypothetical protein